MTTYEVTDLSSNDISNEQSCTVVPDYYLTPEEFERAQDELVKDVERRAGNTVCAVWIPSDHPNANLVRTLEAQKFPEIPDIMAQYEDESSFLAIIDTRDDTNRIVHAFRISSPAFSKKEDASSDDMISIALIQDLVSSEQGLTNADIASYYSKVGVNLNKCLSVETNFKVGDTVDDFNGLPISQVGYLTLFNFVEKQGLSLGEAVVFAHLNRVAVISLRAAGIEYESIVGRDDLKTPTVGDQKYDPHYKPVAIPASEKNLATFKALSIFSPPEINL